MFSIVSYSSSFFFLIPYCDYCITHNFKLFNVVFNLRVKNVPLLGDQPTEEFSIYVL